jgi:hypothetical protein
LGRDGRGGTGAGSGAVEAVGRAECRPSGRQATHEVAAPRRSRRARKRTAVESGAARGAAEVRETSLGWNPGGTAGAG